MACNGLCRRRLRPPGRDGLPRRRGSRHGRRSWPRGCSGRCCSRASRAPARPRSPRPSPRASTCPLVRLQCYEGIDASQALYDWDFPRQILHLRALEAAGAVDSDEAEKSLYDERFLLSRPVARRAAPGAGRAAGRRGRPRRRRVRGVPAGGAVDLAGDHPRVRHGHRDPEPPLVVLTSNRTRELHDAFKRRCLYHWIDHPGLEREVEIVRSRAPEVSETLARQVVGLVQQLRSATTCSSRPASPRPSTGRAPSPTSAPTELDLASAAATLGALLKYREDADRVKAAPGPDAREVTHHGARGRRDPARLRPGAAARPASR